VRPTGPQGPDPAAPGALAHRVEDGLHARPELVRAGSQDNQLALLRGLPGPEYRCVDERQPTVLGQPDAPLGAVLPDRAHLQPDGVFPRAKPGGLHGLEHGIGVRQHGQDHVRAFWRRTWQTAQIRRASEVCRAPMTPVAIG
jgi:hypothetical protein